MKLNTNLAKLKAPHIYMKDCLSTGIYNKNTTHWVSNKQQKFISHLYHVIQ